MAWFHIDEDKRLYYKIEGEGKDTIIFVNGLAMSTSGWRNQIEFFKKDYRMVSYDQRCQGLSFKMESSFHYTLLVEDLLNLMDYLAIDSAHIVGISYGTVVSKEFAIRNPERCKKLVLIVPPRKPDFTFKLFLKHCNNLLEKNQLEDFYDFIFYLSFNRPFSDSLESDYPAMVEGIKRILTAKSMQNLLNSVNWETDLDNYPLLKTETLVLSSSHDNLNNPAAGPQIAGEAENARFKLITGGHAINYDNPDEINQEIRKFLQD